MLVFEVEKRQDEVAGVGVPEDRSGEAGKRQDEGVESVVLAGVCVSVQEDHSEELERQHENVGEVQRR